MKCSSLITLTIYFQMILVAIFSETGFFDYCAVKVSFLNIKYFFVICFADVCLKLQSVTFWGF